MDEVQKVVQGALHTIHCPSPRFWNVPLKKLGHGEVKGPEAYRAAELGESKYKQRPW